MKIVVQAALAALLAMPIAHSQEAHKMTTADQDLVLAQHLIDLHFEIWNEPDAAKRRTRFPQAYSADFFVADYQGVATGYEEVNRMIGKLQGEHAGFSFHPDPVAWNHGIGRVTWNYGPRANPRLVHGEDIFTIKDGKLASARVFLDKQ